MKHIICKNHHPTKITTDCVPTACGLVICYINNTPFKLHRIDSQWAFINFDSSDCYGAGRHDSAVEAMQSVLKYTTELLYFDYFEEFITYHQNR